MSFLHAINVSFQNVFEIVRMKNIINFAQSCISKGEPAVPSYKSNSLVTIRFSSINILRLCDSVQKSLIQKQSSNENTTLALLCVINVKHFIKRLMNLKIFYVFHISDIASNPFALNKGAFSQHFHKLNIIPMWYLFYLIKSNMLS